MFGIGSGEILLLLVIALIVLGPERMPQVARDVGKVMNDLRRTSEELQQELLTADRPVRPAPPAESAATQIEATARPSEAPAAGAAPAEVTADAAPPEPEETEFDREARLARERLEGHDRAAKAAAEGWTAPTDEAGTSDRTG